MRIAVISAPVKKRQPPEYVAALAKGMSKMGHHVDIIDAWTEDGFKLPGYDYIAIVTAPVSFLSGKIPENVSKIISVGSSLVGKKSAAFIKRTGFFNSRALSNLMKVMEKEGMRINWSDLLYNNSHAEFMGKRIGI